VGNKSDLINEGDEGTSPLQSQSVDEGDPSSGVYEGSSPRPSNSSVSSSPRFRPKSKDKDKRRAVSVEEARDWARIENMDFFETSALTGQFVEDMFRRISLSVSRVLPEVAVHLEVSYLPDGWIACDKNGVVTCVPLGPVSSVPRNSSSSSHGGAGGGGGGGGSPSNAVSISSTGGKTSPTSSTKTPSQNEDGVNSGLSVTDINAALLSGSKGTRNSSSSSCGGSGASPGSSLSQSDGRLNSTSSSNGASSLRISTISAGNTISAVSIATKTSAREQQQLQQQASLPVQNEEPCWYMNYWTGEIVTERPLQPAPNSPGLLYAARGDGLSIASAERLERLERTSSCQTAATGFSYSTTTRDSTATAAAPGEFGYGADGLEGLQESRRSRSTTHGSGGKGGAGGTSVVDLAMCVPCRRRASMGCTVC
jgi:hypothetical protein